ncbi:MAG: DUF1622 domain-containing protein [Acidimicrobiia bacterium]
MEFEEAMGHIARAFEAAGVAIIVIGGVVALVTGLRDFADLDRFFSDVRRGFGRPLILGLEILVAADIIQTITVDPSLESVGVLAILVAVRIALSFSLDIEVDGMLPWRRAEMSMRSPAAGDDPEQEK